MLTKIYTHTYIRIMTRIMSHIYICLLELRSTPAAYCKSIRHLYNNILFLYNFVRDLYTFTPYI